MTKTIIKINNWDQNQNTSSIDTSEDNYPCLYNLSGRFFYQLLPTPIETADPEFVYLSTSARPKMETLGILAHWNMAWEAGQFRTDICTDDLPKELLWLKDVEDRNIYLLPDFKKNKYGIYSTLYHLLPTGILKKFGLPLLDRGQWPVSALVGNAVQDLPSDFDEKLSKAFAYHVWPLMNSQSGISAFDKSDSLQLLAHNLNFWLPYAFKVAENRLKENERTDYDNEEHRRIRDEAQAEQPAGIVDIRPPVKGGAVWQGQEDAWEATKELVDLADRRGNLRSIIDAVNSHRVKDDFSSQWSFAREDFERKMYSKRSKIKIAFVELDETIPVHSHESEIHEKLLWENFIALLDPKEKQVVVCLRNGTTKLTEIARQLGYANHSPISKALTKIQKKAKKYLE